MFDSGSGGYDLGAQIEELAAVDADSEPSNDGALPARGSNRRDVRRYLTLDDFPASRNDLLAICAINGAPEELIEQLRSLPLTGSFENLDELRAALDTDSHRT